MNCNKRQHSRHCIIQKNSNEKLYFYTFFLMKGGQYDFKGTKTQFWISY